MEQEKLEDFIVPLKEASYILTIEANYGLPDLVMREWELPINKEIDYLLHGPYYDLIKVYMDANADEYHRYSVKMRPIEKDVTY